MSEARIGIPKDRIAEFCKRNQVRRLSLFGSVLREVFGPDSDVDILMEFEPGTRMGLIQLSGLEIELGKIVGCSYNPGNGETCSAISYFQNRPKDLRSWCVRIRPK